MKKLRVFQTVRIKRIVPGFSLKNLGTVLLFLLFLPYLITFLFGNLSAEEPIEAWKDSIRQLEEGNTFVCNITSLGEERIPLELYVADKLARSIDCDYELEALKAQAVLIRSAALSERKNANEDITLADQSYGEGTVTEKVLQAVTGTKGVYLSWHENPISGAYFEVSNGTTRNGGEVGLLESDYLKSVSCKRDFMSEDYMKLIFYDEQEFERMWEQIARKEFSACRLTDRDTVVKEEAPENVILYRDSADYVLYVERNGEGITGEQFRMVYHLPSACFSISTEGEEIKISVRGVGHGLGMSQFGANEMAKDEMDYVEILNYFFQDVTITKFE